MKLERFNKNKKQKRIIVSSIIGILLVVGTIILYRTYAFFEEKKEFNVIKGQVPEFSHEDIQLSWYIGDVKQTNSFPKKDDGYVGTTVICEKGASAEWSNAIWGLVNINPNNQKKVYCSVTFENGNTIADNDVKAEKILCGTNIFGISGTLGCNGNTTGYDTRIKVGDLISLTPTLNEFTISSSLTGYTDDQIIHPNYNRLWRVIKIYKDGRIDVISEYSSSNLVTFNGKIGYQNFIGTLNTIASAYSVSGYTVDARSIGYNGQTEYLTEGSTFPFETTTNNANEAEGGGDIMYQADIGSSNVTPNYGSEEGLIYNIYKNYRGDTPKPLFAYQTKTDGTQGGIGFYWIASRKVLNSNGVKYLIVHRIHLGGELFEAGVWESYNGEHYHAAGIRPILTLKSGLSIKSGSGTIGTPWVLN